MMMDVADDKRRSAHTRLEIIASAFELKLNIFFRIFIPSKPKTYVAAYGGVAAVSAFFDRGRSLHSDDWQRFIALS